MGGKARVGKHIAAVINPIRDGRKLWDPFCGGLGAASALGGDILCTDIHPGLIALYQKLQSDPDWLARKLNGQPVSEAEYARARTLPDNDPWKAFVGFSCSFGGKWLGGYSTGSDLTSGEPTDWAGRGERTLGKKLEKLSHATFKCQSFFDTAPGYFDGVLYLDPPYRGTAGFKAGPFDHDAFEIRALEWARSGCDVFVSEYDFPCGEEVMSTVSCGLRTTGKKPQEKLFYIEGAK